jgi:hypothetical protein
VKTSIRSQTHGVAGNLASTLLRPSQRLQASIKDKCIPSTSRCTKESISKLYKMHTETLFSACAETKPTSVWAVARRGDTVPQYHHTVSWLYREDQRSMGRDRQDKGIRAGEKPQKEPPVKRQHSSITLSTSARPTAHRYDGESLV